MRSVFTKGRKGSVDGGTVDGSSVDGSTAARLVRCSQSRRGRIVAALVVLSLAVGPVVTSCTARNGADNAATVPADPAGDEGQGTPPVAGETADAPREAETDGATADAAPAAEPPASTARGTTTGEGGVPRYLLAEGSLARLAPSDAEIGELIDNATAGHNIHALRRVVEGFFTALHAPADAVADYVLESEQLRIGRMIESDLPAESSPRIRFGRVQWLGGDQAIMRVRLIDAAARTSGDIMLERPADEWRIVDLMLSLRELEPPAAGPEVRLEPWAERSPLVAP